MKTRRIENYFTTGILILCGLAFLYPLVWMVLLSLKTTKEMYTNPFGLPQAWRFENYSESLTAYDFPKYMVNSTIYTGATIILTVVCAGLFAYAASRMRWKGQQFAVSYILLGLVIPVQVVIIPLVIILKTLHIKNTYLGLILPYTASMLPLSISILYGFFRSLPYELEESACIDGCNIFQTFFRIVLPMVKPAVSTVVIIVFLNAWNEFFMAFMLITSSKMRSLPIGLLNFMTGRQIEWGLLGATMVITSIPTVLIYLLNSEQIEKALTSGAILK